MDEGILFGFSNTMGGGFPPSALGNVWYKAGTTSPCIMKSNKLEDIAKSQRCPLTFPDGCSMGTSKAPLGEL